MLPDFEKFVSKNQLFTKKDKLLLAISGGKDSICLFHLLIKGNYRFSLAHCNFQLRGKESDNDESFIRNLAAKNNIECHCIRFDTKQEAKRLKKGIQETARILRYDWFEKIRKKGNYAVILTAHHLSDNTETMLINLFRSTGVSGLHGIPLKQGRIVRPLMFCDRDRIDSFVKKYRYKFTHDKSNDSDDYLRNMIRHHLIPVMKTMEPKTDGIFSSVSLKVNEYESLTENLLELLWKKHSEKSGDWFFISDSAFKSIKNVPLFLYYFLKPYGFSRASTEAFKTFKTIRIGAHIESDMWTLCRERNGFKLYKNKKVHIDSIALKTAEDKIRHHAIKIDLKTIKPSKVDFSKSDTLFFDLSQCHFPLSIRKWLPADRMQPLGMKGSKNISDILTDRKMEHSRRNEQMVLLDKDGVIMALLPSIVSEKHKIRLSTRSVLAFKLKIA